MIRLAKSLAGHDRGKIYLVLEESETFVLVVNGKQHLLEASKKKNKKHIQIIKKIPDQVRELLDPQKALTDEIVSKAIRSYERSLSKEGTSSLFPSNQEET